MMELSIRRKNWPVEILKSFYNAQKGDNVYYEEERVIPQGDISASYGMLKEEFEKIVQDGDILTIVDPYFLCISEEEVEEYLNTFLKIVDGRVRAFQIVTNKHIRKYGRKNAVDKNEACRRVFNEYFKLIDVVMLFREFEDGFHDRFWLTNRTTGISLGTSFNGIGKKLSLVYEIDANDLKILEEELRKKGILLNPDLS